MLPLMVELMVNKVMMVRNQIHHHHPVQVHHHQAQTLAQVHHHHHPVKNVTLLRIQTAVNLQVAHHHLIAHLTQVPQALHHHHPAHHQALIQVQAAHQATLILMNVIIKLNHQ